MNAYEQLFDTGFVLPVPQYAIRDRAHIMGHTYSFSIESIEYVIDVHGIHTLYGYKLPADSQIRYAREEMIVREKEL